MLELPRNDIETVNVSRIADLAHSWEHCGSEQEKKYGRFKRRMNSALIADPVDLIAEIIARDAKKKIATDKSFDIRHFISVYSFPKELCYEACDLVMERADFDFKELFCVGNYRLKARGNSGGFGRIFIATNPAGIEFALKRNKDNAIAQNEFENAKILARDEGIVSPIDLFRFGKYTFLVLNYYHGATLEEHIFKPHLNLRRKIELLIQASASLKFMHENSLIHRDIKPSNMLITDSGFIKILDLGNALSSRHSSDNKFRQDMMENYTAEYCAPEVVKGIDKEPKCAHDIYSFGLTAYEFIQDGRLALQFDSIPFKHIPNVPTELNSLLELMIKSDPKERIKSFDEVHSGLLKTLERVRDTRDTVTSCPDKFFNAAISVESSRANSLTDLLSSIEKTRCVPAKFLYLFEGAAELWIKNTKKKDYSFYNYSMLAARKEFEAILNYVSSDQPISSVISLGAGDGAKDISLLELLHSKRPSDRITYIPVDISDGLLVEALRLLRSQEFLRGGFVDVLAVVGDIAHLDDFDDLFCRGDGVRLFTMLGNTIGNSSEHEFFAAISKVMRSRDYVLFEINVSIPRHGLDVKLKKDSVGIPVDDDFERFRFLPLRAAGVHYEPSKVCYKVLTGLSIIPRSFTTACYYELTKIGDITYPYVYLSLIHHYDHVAFQDTLRNFGLKSVRSFVYGEKVCMILAQKD
jgi:serine/threonine protein kinase